MEVRERYLISTLLIIIGILIGSIVTLYLQIDSSRSDNAEVRFTEIARSVEPREDSARYEGDNQNLAFQKIAENVTPTVVYIESAVAFEKRSAPNDENHDFNDNFWDEMLPRRRAQTVGSGIIISSDGYILTNNHVVEGADDNIKVTLKDKRAFDARIVGRDPNTDLAVLKVDAKNLPSIRIGNSDQVNVGDWVLAIGNPFRLRSTVTAGIVSALSRQVQVINERLSIESFIQTDAAINRGNSGGALINTRGELIGINTAIATETGNYQGYGFAVPVNLAIKVAEDIIEFGRVKRALLGITIGRVDYERAMKLGMETVRGVEVVELVPNGAAEEFGLKKSDVILSVNSKNINEISELQERIALQRPGDIAHLEIWRNGDVKKIDVVLKGTDQFEENSLALQEERPNNNLDLNVPELDNTVFSVKEYDFGLTLVALPNSKDISKNDLIVLRVKNESKAEQAGFKKGWQIVELNGKRVENLKTLTNLVNEAKSNNEEARFSVVDEKGETSNLTIQF